MIACPEPSCTVTRATPGALAGHLVEDHAIASSVALTRAREAESGPLPPSRTEPAAPAVTPPAWDFSAAVRAFKREWLTARLTEVGGCHTTLAKRLGIHRPNVLRLLRELAIDVPRTVPVPKAVPRCARCRQPGHYAKTCRA